MKKDIKINYLYHSAFTLETPNYLLIFDYYKDNVDSEEKNISNGAIGETDLKKEKKIVVFSSHSHYDHFNPIILSWRKIRPDIKYIFSDDISIEERNNNIKFLKAYEETYVEDIYVKAYGSTDIGVSFMVKVEGFNIFHAGDLNWWYWNGDTEENIKEAEKSFKAEVEKIKGENIDICFFPVDPRLEGAYCIGGEYFIKNLSPKLFIPMHFGEEYNITKAFSKIIKDSNTKVIEISRSGEEIIF